MHFLRIHKYFRFFLLAAISIALLAILIIIFFIFDKVAWNNWKGTIACGLKCERNADYITAIKYYQRLDSVINGIPDGRGACIIEYESRCFFLLGDIDNAIAKCNERITWAASYYPEGLKSYKIGSAKLSVLAMQLQQAGNFAESLIYCNKMISLSSDISNYPSSMGHIGGVSPLDDRYYSGSSEGYIRKYNALVHLGLKDAADKLLNEYKLKYRSNIVENYWKQLDNVELK